ncbi:hypothetical protein [Paraflavitalea speifideaquila]|uniref:hypothetical protein n=1 Tax=Paraflavitalea speifideaquila TaxID=3076558 RepID=UPI0028E199BF|nr:hypothetical protein [Paraflavitalea speifideiaquila]
MVTITVYPQLVAGSVTPASASINYNTSPGLLTGTVATGGNSTYAYQWQSSPDNSTYTNIGGATAQNYTPGNLTANIWYRRTVTSNGVTLNSNVVTVTVYPQLVAGSVTPASASINYNTSPGLLTGTAATGGNGTYAYQWQSSSDNTTYTNIGGATAQNYTPGNLIANTWYRRTVTSNGVTVNSNTVAVTVYPQLVPGTVSPASISINYNTAPGLLTGTAATGGNGTYAYQWQSSPDNTTFTNIGGAMAQNYTPGNLTANTWYRRSVTSNGVTVNSNTVAVTVYPQLVAGTLSPAALSINYNTSPGLLSGTAATGGNGSYTYQWQSSPDNTTYTNIGGATAQNYTPGNLIANTWYRRTVTSNGVTVNSNTVAVTVYPQLVAGSVTPASASINYNTSPGLLTGTAATGGNGTYAYQWQSSSDNTTYTNIGGATAQNYTPGNLIANTWYRRSVTSNGVTVNSNTVAVTVYPQLVPGTVTPASISINYNTAPGLLTGTAATGGNGTLLINGNPRPIIPPLPILAALWLKTIRRATSPPIPGSVVL